LQNGVTEKFQALIIEMPLFRLVSKTRVRQRFGEKKRVPKFVADAFLERIQLAEIYPMAPALTSLSSA
jgi:hypothetical protein